LINADNLQLCLAVLMKPSTAKQSCKLLVINDVRFAEQARRRIIGILYA